MKISVIIPTYKPQSYLWECLDSVSNQTFPKSDFEVIIILNGIKEPYYSSLMAYFKNNAIPNFYIRYSDKAGVSAARNLALNMAKGEYITFIDDDDYISPAYLEELYSAATREVVSLCYPLSFVDGTNNYVPFYITADYERYVGRGVCPFYKAKKYFSGPVYKLIHRDIIGDRRYDERFTNGEDAVFMFLISDRFKKVSFTSRHAIYYRRIREGSALMQKKSISMIFVNSINMMLSYTCVFFKHPFRYKAVFFFTRLLGAVHGAMEQIKLRTRRM